ncbi:class I SAM-dependent methyltransferase [Rhodocaloribacter litoris]|uniref:class I SAM-dependent DNA methyltransferase n=1 Tax=Rhodocaloribacter litoris TaxID=2558931 RepID=UPI00142384EE|nr:class I SAM-dependent methyltransferase [Rhodocaloribacter litoris]QXD15657.1 class I SAM-dependent methyltransferase [Rhodocaloribacter litoris]GIV61588.1 MAG: methyltransferase [Rhodothermaceae bacterium]
MPTPVSKEPRQVPPYTVLAAGYDVVMEHVDYALWAAYVHELLERHHGDVETILELGCGTGSLAFELAPLGPYRYAGTDAVPQMIRVARAKAELLGPSIQFEVADFTNYRVQTPVDAVVLLYDGLNYLLEEARLHDLFRCTFRALKPGGLFVFDQSTPANSLNNEAFFEDEGGADAFAFRRTSHYDPGRRLHTTTFEITVAGQSFFEAHVQRAYTMEEVRGPVEAAGFEVVAAYDGFTHEPAHADSERIHWVARRPPARP